MNLMIEQRTHFKIITSGYKCSKWIVDCLQSVHNQKYDNWQMIVHIDHSPDNTYAAASEYIECVKDSRIMLIGNSERRLCPKNDLEAIALSKAKQEDVLVFLDADDWLYDAYVFQYLNTVYSKQDIWVTWGSYINSHNGERGKASTPFSEEHKDQRIWRYSHLKTFKYFLFKGVQDEDLRDKDSGEYYTPAWDMSFMFPIVEMAGKEHSKFISKILYVYNTENSISNEKVDLQKCLRFANEIIKERPMYSQQTREELCR